MKTFLFDKKRNIWLPSKYKKQLQLIFENLITKNDVCFGKIDFSTCNENIQKAFKTVLPNALLGVLYIIKKIDGENIYNICVRDIEGLETSFSDVRHSIKKYLNG